MLEIALPARHTLGSRAGVALALALFACSSGGSAPEGASSGGAGGAVGGGAGTPGGGRNGIGGASAGSGASGGAGGGAGASATGGASGASATGGASGASGGTTGGNGGAGGASGGTGGATGGTSAAGGASGGTAGTTGGTGAAGMNGGGRAAGGSGAGGASGGAGGAGAPSAYPCDGPTSDYDATVLQDGDTWTVSHGATVVTTSTDMATAMYAGINSLTANRTAKESVLVRGSGDISANSQTNLPNFLVLNICGTINVTGTASGSDKAPIYARGRHDLEIPNLKMTGAPMYGLFLRQVDNLTLGHLELRLSGGLGVRIDNNAGSVKNHDVSIGYVYGEGTSSHIVETYGIDQIDIGTVEGKDVGECGLLLNNTTNAEVGLVRCEDCGTGTGYAAFRIANDAGKIGDDWPPGNIHVGQVYARGGGRGIFSVSGSGGLTIDHIDIADTGNNAILLQNCINTSIAAVSGTVSTGTVLLSNDTDNTDSGKFEPSRNVTLQNLVLSNGATVSEAWCELGDRMNRAANITGGSVNMCVD